MTDMHNATHEDDPVEALRALLDTLDDGDGDPEPALLRARALLPTPGRLSQCLLEPEPERVALLNIYWLLRFLDEGTDTGDQMLREAVVSARLALAALDGRRDQDRGAVTALDQAIDAASGSLRVPGVAEDEHPTVEDVLTLAAEDVLRAAMRLRLLTGRGPGFRLAAAAATSAEQLAHTVVGLTGGEVSVGGYPLPSFTCEELGLNAPVEATR